MGARVAWSERPVNTLHAIAIVAASSAIAFASTPFVIRFAGAIGAVIP